MATYTVDNTTIFLHSSGAIAAGSKDGPAQPVGDWTVLSDAEAAAYIAQLNQDELDFQQRQVDAAAEDAVEEAARQVAVKEAFCELLDLGLSVPAARTISGWQGDASCA